jgi:hypothetical protein
LLSLLQIPGVEEFIFAVVSNVLHLIAPFMLIIGTILAFAGRKLVKLLVFLAGGLLGGAMAYWLTLNMLGENMALIIAVVGFVGVGLLCVAFIPIIFGISLGFVAYYIADLLALNMLIGVIAGVAGFVLGIFLYNHVLSIVTGVVGGALILQGLVSLGIPTYISLLVAFLMMVVGTIFQLRQLSKK